LFFAHVAILSVGGWFQGKISLFLTLLNRTTRISREKRTLDKIKSNRRFLAGIHAGIKGPKGSIHGSGFGVERQTSGLGDFFCVTAGSACQLSSGHLLWQKLCVSWVLSYFGL
jgi:hypothetical protein